MPRLFPAGQVFFDGAGNVAASGTVTVYDNGTTNLATVYSEKTLTTSSANPLTLASDGRLPNDVYVSDNGTQYTVLVRDGDSAQVTSDDDVVPSEQAGGSLPNGGDKFSINPGGAVSSPGGTFGFNFGNTVSSSATVTQDVDAASGGRWIGVVLVGSSQVSNSTNRQDAIIYITDDGQATLSSNSNGSGSSFTLAYASGTLTLTNTSGGSAHMSMTVLGGGRTF